MNNYPSYWRYTKVRKGEKSPVDKNWQNNPLMLSDIDITTNNIGVLLGVPSETMVIDFDHKDALEIFENEVMTINELLKDNPITWTSGKTDYNFSVAFRVDPWFAKDFTSKKYTRKSEDTGKVETIFEIRWSKCQCLIPPSIHPTTQKPYTWITAPNANNHNLMVPTEVFHYWANWCSNINDNHKITTSQNNNIINEDDVINAVESIQKKFPSLDYYTWRDTSYAVAKSLNSVTDAIDIMKYYYPEKKIGEYGKLFSGYNIEKSPGFGSLYIWAKEANPLYSTTRFVDITTEKKPYILPDISNINITVYDEPPGGGKTTAHLEKILNSGGGSVWWVAVAKIDPLMSEMENRLHDMAAALGNNVVTDFISIHSSSPTLCGTVIDTLNTRMTEIKEALNTPEGQNTIYVTFFTHKTLLDNPFVEYFGNIIIDEPIDIWGTSKKTVTKSRDDMKALLTPVNKCVDDDSKTYRLKLTDLGIEKLQNDDLKDISNEGWEYIIKSSFITDGHLYVEKEVWDDDEYDNIDFISVLTPYHLASFTDIYISAAYLSELSLYKIWEEIFGVKFKLVKLRNDSIDFAGRVKVYYFLHNINISKRWFSRPNNGLRFICEKIRELEGDDIIWTANDDVRIEISHLMPHSVIDAESIIAPSYISPKAHGINRYRDLTAAAWLASIKLPPFMVSMFNTILPDTKLVQETEYYPMLQFLTRTAIRKWDSNEPVRFYVMDKMQAEYLHGLLGLHKSCIEHIEIVGVYDEKSKRGRDTKSSRNTKHSTLSSDQKQQLLNEQSKERMRKKREKEKLIRASNISGADVVKLATRFFMTKRCRQGVDKV